MGKEMDMDTLTLTAPEAVTAIPVAKAVGLVPVDDAKKTELEKRVATYVDQLVAMNTSSPDFTSKVDQLSNLGQKEIRDAASQSNRFLDKPIKAMDGESGVGKDLIRLRGVVESLDPGRRGNLLEPRKLFGLIPFGNKVKEYFQEYQPAQAHISEILKSLASGKDELLMDIAAIDGERARMWNQMGQLEQMILMAATLDQKLEEKANDLDASDPAKAKALRETALFYTRQRRQDLVTQMAVTIQGYLALDMVKKNDIELVKGVDRASTTTVAALRTAVTVAQALTSQKMVLEQITALNGTTASIIESTGALMRDNTARIQEQAASSTIPVEVLQRAFQNIYATMDSIDAFKLKALDSMKTTVDALSVETAKAQKRIAAQGDVGKPVELLSV